MLDAQTLTVQACKGDFLGVVLRAVVKGYSQRDTTLVLVEEGNTVHPSGEDDESVTVCHRSELEEEAQDNLGGYDTYEHPHRVDDRIGHGAGA